MAPPEQPTFESLLDDMEPPSRSLVTVNRTESDPVQRLLASAFEGQPVAVEERSLPDHAENVVLLVDDGEVVASSALEDVMNAFLLVNSDLHRSGTAGFESRELPAVLANLDETVFDLRGYPESDKEKLLLILVSRFVERRAWQTGDGTLRSTFQRLSRIEDERGTRTVYERVSEAGVDVHVYGVPDQRPPDTLDVVVHAGDSVDYRRSWCVVFTPPAGSDGHAALVAVETEARRWRGAWTYRPDRVREIEETLQRAF